MPDKVKEQCPDCGKEYIGLALHRRLKHGVTGATATKRKSRRALPTPIAEVTNEQEELDNHISFAFGVVYDKLENISTSIGLPFPIVAHRVAELLYRATNGKVLGNTLRMPTMRGKAA
jgi:hypothetical protein